MAKLLPALQSTTAVLAKLKAMAGAASVDGVIAAWKGVAAREAELRAAAAAADAEEEAARVALEQAAGGGVEEGGAPMEDDGTAAPDTTSLSAAVTTARAAAVAAAADADRLAAATTVAKGTLDRLLASAESALGCGGGRVSRPSVGAQPPRASRVSAGAPPRASRASTGACRRPSVGAASAVDDQAAATLAALTTRLPALAAAAAAAPPTAEPQARPSKPVSTTGRGRVGARPRSGPSGCRPTDADDAENAPVGATGDLDDGAVPSAAAIKARAARVLRAEARARAAVAGGG